MKDVKCKIFKYELRQQDEQNLSLPVGAKILSVKTQREKFVLYANVNPSIEKVETYEVKIHGTGHDNDLDGFAFLGTVFLKKGDLVFHIFYRKK